MKIYLASSWRNREQMIVLAELRAAGHEVYDFRNPVPGNRGAGRRVIFLVDDTEGFEPELMYKMGEVCLTTEEVIAALGPPAPKLTPSHIRPCRVPNSDPPRYVGVSIDCAGGGQPLRAGKFCPEPECGRDMSYKLGEKGM